MSEEKAIKRKRRRKRAVRRSVVDSAARNVAVLTDGCNPEFVEYPDWTSIVRNNYGSGTE